MSFKQHTILIETFKLGMENLEECRRAWLIVFFSFSFRKASRRENVSRASMLLSKMFIELFLSFPVLFLSLTALLLNLRSFPRFIKR